MNIYIDTIDHSEQRYPTVGDYYYPLIQNSHESPYMEVKISKMENEDYEFLVLIHELIEAHLCRKRGISEHSITEFDVLFEQNRTPESLDEPGNSEDAPYHKEHVFATKIERQLAEELGVDWDKYDEVVNSL